MQSNWFWNNMAMNAFERGLLNLTHWIWIKRHGAIEFEEAPTPAVKVEPVVKEKKPAARKPAAKKAPKGSEWSVK